MRRSTPPASTAAIATAKLPASANTTTATMMPLSISSSARAVARWLRRSIRRRTSSTAPRLSTSPPALMMPNHTTGSQPPKEGMPVSRRKWASRSRSNASEAAPKITAMARIVPSTGRRLTSASPPRSVAPIARQLSRSSRAAGWKPVSGITHSSTAASPRQSTPPSSIGRLREISPRPTPTGMPSKVPSCPACAARRKTGAARSSPSSSTTHASVAPLVKV